MSLDGAFLYAVKNELQPLVGSRLDKVNQPSRDEVILSFRTRDGAKKLLISANAASSRIHFTEKKTDNPKTPPMFCTLMRKHFGGARLSAIEQDGLERILTLKFDATNELGDPTQPAIVCEIMGRHSNIVIISEDGRVIDSIKRVDEDISRERIIIPGIKYEAPPRRKRMNLFNFDADELSKLLETSGQKNLSKALVDIFEGISPIIAREFAFFVSKTDDIAAQDCRGKFFERLNFIIKETAFKLSENRCDFCITVSKDGIYKDFSFIKISQYGNMMIRKNMESASAVLDEFFYERDNAVRRKQRAEDLFNILSRYSDKLSRKINIQRQEILDCAEKDKYKLYGNLISANIYRMTKGESSIILQNYFDGMKEIKISLNPRMTPSQNAQKYYALYRKKCTAEKILAEQIEIAENESVYIDSVFDSLTRAESIDEIELIRTELYEQGYLKKRNKIQKVKESAPIEFISSDGFKIYVGRNNKQNDYLTLKWAHKHDVWLHTHNIPGAHVIIETGGEDVPEKTLLEAAQIAAYYSKAVMSARVPVDYCPVKFVKKPNGAKPGMVIFSNNRTLYVTPGIPSEEKHEN